MVSTSSPVSVSGERWRSRRLASWSLRALIFLAPLAAAVAASLWLSGLLFNPESATEVVAWWAILIGFSSMVAWGVDRHARRLLPLTVMLRATMLFPDRAPPRYRVALRNSNVKELRRRVSEAESGGSTDLSAAAELILSLASALNDHDRRTRGHGERTRAYTDMLAEELKVPQEGRDKLRWAALLHDIGKLDVPAAILNKDGPLEEHEMAIVRRHPLLGMRVAAALVPWLGEWAGAIEHHHEWWDGSGYPRGLAGEEISMAARIVSVADAYDVMTSGRSYQAAMAPEEARREVAKMAGRQFDPTVVRALMNVSLGRLRWMLGPMTWLGQVPFFLDRLGRDFITVSTAATVTAAAMVSGIVPLPSGLASPVPDLSAMASPVTTTVGVEGGPGANGNGGGNEGGTNSSTGVPGTLVPGSALDEDSTTTIPSTTVTTNPSTTLTTTPPTTATTTTTAPPSSTTTLPPHPVAQPDVASTDQGQVVLVDVTANDTPAGLHLAAIPSPPDHGIATISNNQVRYAPGSGFHGTDTLTYRACDAGGRCAESTVAIIVTKVNQPPVIRDDSAVTDRDTPVAIAVLANDTDPDGDTLAIRSTSAPSNGSVSFSASSVTYRPAAGFTGTDTFTYRACDPSGACGTATVTVTVRAVPRPPNAVDDVAYYHPGGQERSVDVLANDTHPDGTALDPGSVRVTSGPANGQITSVVDGVVSYTMRRGFTGTDSFVYRVCDVRGLCDTATVTLTKAP